MTVDASLLEQARKVRSGTTIRGLVSEAVLEVGDDPVLRRQAVDSDSVESVSVAVALSRLSCLRDTRVREICAALAVAIGCSD